MKLAIGLLFGLAALVALSSCHQGHSHDDNPAFKYSRAANEVEEDEIFEEDIIDLPPQKAHSHGGGHGHSHGGGHGHSHGGGHGHSHGGGHGHSHGGGHGHSHGKQRELTPEEREKYRERLHKIWDDDDEEVDECCSGKRSVWMQAIGATLLISAAPFFILFFIPLDNSKEKQWLMKIFLSFASGGLLGDAFLHLIPHAMMSSEGEGGEGGHAHSHSHSHGHSHGGGGEEGGHAHDMTVGLGVLSGIIAFLVVEKLVRIVNGGEGGHGHSHGGGSDKKSDIKKEEKESAKKESAKKESGDKKKDAKESDKKDDDDKEESDKKDDDDKEESDKKKDDKKKEEKSVVAKKEEEVKEGGEVKVAGYLNLFADCFHNFTDGLAIGASFAAGESVGVITTLTILLHEVPHEIGDYAILIQSGVPPMKAIMLQLLTAVGALTGCVVSLLAQGGGDGGLQGSSSAFILPFTAGGFIYIATVSVIPDILEGASTLKQSFMEIVALLSGVAMMVIIAQYE